MRTHRLVLPLAVLLTLGLAFVAPEAQAVTTVHLAAQIHGSAAHPAARGISDYERDSTHRVVEVRMSHLGTLAGRRVVVFVGLKKVGLVLVSFTGHAQREWDTDHGQSVPLARAGTHVRIRTRAGALVAVGKYVRAL